MFILRRSRAGLVYCRHGWRGCQGWRGCHSWRDRPRALIRHYNILYIFQYQHVAQWLRFLHCCLTARRSWVWFPHGALLALGGQSGHSVGPQIWVWQLKVYVKMFSSSYWFHFQASTQWIGLSYCMCPPRCWTHSDCVCSKWTTGVSSSQTLILVFIETILHLN